MKNLLNFPNYFLLMIIAELIYIIKIPSIFSMNAIAILLFNFLAIKFTIKHPLEKNKNLTKKDIYKPLLIVSSIIITILMKKNYHAISTIIIVLIGNFIEIYLMKPKDEKLKELMDKNIKEYYENKK